MEGSCAPEAVPEAALKPNTVSQTRCASDQQDAHGIVHLSKPPAVFLWTDDTLGTFLLWRSIDTLDCCREGDAAGSNIPRYATATVPGDSTSHTVALLFAA